MRAENEARITINGVSLSPFQSLTIRVALESLGSSFLTESLGDEGIGKDIESNYLKEIQNLRVLMGYGATDKQALDDPLHDPNGNKQ